MQQNKKINKSSINKEINRRKVAFLKNSADNKCVIYTI